MAGFWAALAFKSSERLFGRPVGERIANTRHDFVAKRLVAGFGERRLGLAGMLLALAAKLARSAPRGRRRGACRSVRWMPAALAALATAASSSRCVVRPSVTGSLGVMFAMFQWRAVADRGDRRARGADQLADLPVGDLGMVLDDPGDSVRLVLALGDRRVARSLGAADCFGRLVHLERVVGVVLPLARSPRGSARRRGSDRGR